mgnify:CR=1 FL=1
MSSRYCLKPCHHFLVSKAIPDRFKGPTECTGHKRQHSLQVGIEPWVLLLGHDVLLLDGIHHYYTTSIHTLHHLHYSFYCILEWPLWAIVIHHIWKFEVAPSHGFCVQISSIMDRILYACGIYIDLRERFTCTVFRVFSITVKTEANSYLLQYGPRQG